MTSPATTAPLISVIIAVRNGARTLERCLQSVFEQEDARYEVVVMDGASTDGSQGILASNGDRLQYWESAPDRGIYHAWNKALSHTRGEWICFLGSDDRFHGEDVLSRVSMVLASDNGRHRIVYGGVDIVDETGAVVGREGQPWTQAREGFREGMTIPHPATFHHRSLFEARGTFDERFEIAGDYELLLRELKDHEALFVPGIVVTDMAAGGISDRPERDGTRAREKHLARRMHGLEATPEWRSPLVIRAVTRAWLARTFGRRIANTIRDAYRAARSLPARLNGG